MASMGDMVYLFMLWSLCLCGPSVISGHEVTTTTTTVGYGVGVVVEDKSELEELKLKMQLVTEELGAL